MELKLPNKSFFWPRLIILFSLFSTLLFLTLYFYKSSENKILINQIKSEQKAMVAAQKKYISATLDNIGKDLLLSDFIKIHNAYHPTSDNSHRAIGFAELNTLAMSLRKGFYDQLRYLDLEGNEIIRINYNNGIPTIIPDEQLQNKADRYYFQDSLTLVEGDIYVSVLDLNMEHGEIEVPHKPMIRLSTPVFDSNGNKRGIVILNYLAEYLLDGLKIFSLNSSEHHMLVNNNGYFLFYDRHPELEFAFMFPEHQDKTFAHIYPRTNKYIKRHEFGQFTLDSGVLTFDAVPSYPRTVNSLKDFQIVKQENSWRLITYSPHSAQWPFQGLSHNDHLILLCMVLFSLSLAYIITHLQAKKQQDDNKIKELAHYDDLTKLINRSYFNQLFEWKIKTAQKHSSKLALIYIDLDKFKALNDNFGHNMGDLALKAVADNLRNAFTHNAYVARLGGDEFAVLVYDLLGIEDAIIQVDNYLQLSQKPLILNEQEHTLYSSVGIAFYPEHGTNMNDLIHNADVAMYNIKRSGKDGCRVFSL